MSLVAECRGCGKQYKVDEKFAGKKAKCKNCGAAIAIPAAPPPPEPDDPFAAMDELERTGAVQDAGYALAATAPAAATAAAPVQSGKYVLRAAPPPPRQTGKDVGLAALWFVVGPPGILLIVWAIELLIAVAGLTSAKAATALAAPVAIGGFAFAIIGGYWCRKEARENGFTFLHALIPGYNIWFAIQNWDAMSRPVYCWARGLALILVASAVYGRAGLPVPWHNHLPPPPGSGFIARAIVRSASSPKNDEADDESATAAGDESAAGSDASEAAADPNRPDQEAVWPATLAPFPPADSKQVSRLAEPHSWFDDAYEIRFPNSFRNAGIFGGTVMYKPDGSLEDEDAAFMTYSVIRRFNKSRSRPRIFVHLKRKSPRIMDAEGWFEGAKVDFGTIDGVAFAHAVGKDKIRGPYFEYLACDGDMMIRISASQIAPDSPKFALLDAAARSFHRVKPQ